MARYSIIDANTNIVVNKIVAQPDYDPGAGYIMVENGGGTGDIYDPQTNTFTSPLPSYPPIEEVRERMQDNAFKIMNKFLEVSSANVEIANTVYSFGTDRESRENIMGINTAIAVGIPIPEPRNWTPKGQATPVQCTHADLAAIGAALLAKKDAHMQVYFTHKAAILAANTHEELFEIDVTTGYDAL